MFRDFQAPGRSPVYAPNAMAATSHPLATQAALEILRDGGNAADAAVAAIAVLAVVEPHMTGIGGDCFSLVATPDGRLHGMNASGRAAQDVSAQKLRDAGETEIAADSVHSVTVPGAIRGWEKLLKDHGRFGLAKVFGRAIEYADKGFAVAPRVAADWQQKVDLLRKDAGSTRFYLKDGRAPHTGEVMRLPALAETLRAVAESGSSAFYEGAIAEDMVTTLRAKGSYLTLDDFSAMEADDLTPITTDYRGVTVAELPPNGQGIIALVMLEILKRFDQEGLDPLGGDRFHLQMEAAKLAYAGRDRFLADPESMRFSASEFLQENYIDRLAGMIRMDAALPRQTEQILCPSSDTVYLSVVDADGMAVSLINSLYNGFGSGITAPNSGVLLQNRGSCFSLEAGHDNELSGGKRPLHTIIPAMAMRDGKAFLSFGVMGGGYQPCGHAHVLSNMLDYGMDVQAALDCPRLFLNERNLSLIAEMHVPEATIASLHARGHEVERTTAAIGGGQAILFDRVNGGLVGGSDPRKDGCALGY
ncbi:gamma-glutamyltransferase [Pseudovibrio sp. SPO723]|uniref:gamma-glutamyltransferase n=1 Tax=Nesiotobacter zosterae TaxID=392721 RepID=UPI0029C45C10|nr:gamma-glutamyltransferase [Pseudovibrio sp. SPO723]MDX5594979.1 gamma-glutamyltransferase [Pseudovibrio sp. SPO723]